jgi:hypothetical protein
LNEKTARQKAQVEV